LIRINYQSNRAGCRLTVEDAKRLCDARARRRLAGDPEAAGLDERLQPLAAYVLAGQLYETPWRLLVYGHFKGMEDEAAALALAAWARRNQFNVMFELRRVREHDVLYVLKKDKRQ
jgi:hypothetical protein